MSLKSQMENDMSVFFETDEFADTIYYTPASDDIPSYYVTAIITRDAPFQEDYVRGDAFATCSIEVLRAEFPDELQQGDTFIIDDEVWGFDAEEGITKDDDNTFTIRLERNV